MKSSTIIGSAIVIVMAISVVYLVSSTNLLLPAKFKNRYSAFQNQPDRVEQQQQLNDDDHVYMHDRNPDNKPLYDDALNLNYIAISEVASYKNLQVCLLYGKADLNGKKYVTLNYALKNKMVTLIETQDVNQLSLDNNSDQYIYINSGDIVRGGQQDRTIQYDVVIGPNEKGVDLASFCVEHGRWTPRGDEQVVCFSGSDNTVSSKELKISTKYKKDQSEVWTNVEKYQDKTTHSINNGFISPTADTISVKSEVSATSLELTLDNDEIKKIELTYRNSILKQLKKQPDVVGFAYFINGKLYSIDVFNNHKLFADLFNKLLDAAIAEAISMYDSKQKIVKANSSDIVQLLPANAKVYTDEDVNKNTRFLTSEHNIVQKVLIFTTIDKKEKSWIHRNWLDNSDN